MTTELLYSNTRCCNSNKCACVILYHCHVMNSVEMERVSRHNNQIPSNLPQLQNLIKRDPQSYYDEVRLIVLMS